MRIEIYKFIIFIALAVAVIAVWYWATEGFDKFIQRIGRNFKEGMNEADYEVSQRDNEEGENKND